VNLSPDIDMDLPRSEARPTSMVRTNLRIEWTPIVRSISHRRRARAEGKARSDISARCPTSKGQRSEPLTS